MVIPMLNPSVDEDEKLAISAKMNEKGERMDTQLFAEQQRQLDKAEKAKDEAKQRRIQRLAKQRALIQSAHANPVHAAEAFPSQQRDSQGLYGGACAST